MPITITGGKYASATLVTTTLNGAIDASQTSVVLTDATAFPTSGSITIDNETISYTGKSTNTLTGCTRGASGTTATTHSNGATVRRGGRYDIFVTTTPFVSTDFTGSSPRRIDVFSSGGVFRGTAFVRRWVSTSQLELESELYSQTSQGFVAPVAGDTMLVSRNFADIAQAGLTVANRIATFTDTILFGTAGQQASCCFHDEDYQIVYNVTTAFAQILGVAGGSVSFGHCDFSTKTTTSPCQEVFVSTTNFRSSHFSDSATSARLYVFGGSARQLGQSGALVYLGYRVSAGFVVSGSQFQNLWYLNHAFRDFDINMINPYSVAQYTHIYERCQYIATGANATLLNQGAFDVVGGTYIIPNYATNLMGVSTNIFSANTTLNMASPTGVRSTILDMGNNNVLLAAGRTGGSWSVTFNITNLISTDYRAGDRDTAPGNSPELYSATWVTKNLYWKDPYTNLAAGTVGAMIRNSDWTADSSGTASGSTLDLTVYYGTATGHTTFSTRGSWTARIRKYGYDELEYAVDQTPYSLGSAGTAFNVSFGGLQNQIPNTALTSIADETTALAYTGISITNHGATPVTWNGKQWSITITVDTSVAPTRTASQVWSHVKAKIANTATWGGQAGYFWHVPIIQSGNNFATQRGISGGLGATQKGVRVIDQNGNPFPGIVSMTADDGTTYIPPTPSILTLTGLVAGTKYRVERADDQTLIGEGTTTGTTATVAYSHTSDFAVNCYAGKYGYKRATASGTLTAGTSTIGFIFIQEPFVVANEVTASAYTGITESYTGFTCTLSTIRTLQEIFDYLNYTNSTLANLRYAPLISTVNGLDFQATFDLSINTGVNLDGSGFLDIGSKILTLNGSASYSDTIRIKHGSGTNKTIILSGVANNRNYRIEKQSDQSMVYQGTATTTSQSIKHLYTTNLPVKLITGQYGYKQFTTTFTIDDQIQTINVNNLSEPFVVANEATAGAYTGITANFGSNTVTLTTSRTLQELFDYLNYQSAQLSNLTYTPLISTVAGITLSANFATTVNSGILSSSTQILDIGSNNFTINNGYLTAAIVAGSGSTITANDIDLITGNITLNGTAIYSIQAKGILATGSSSASSKIRITNATNGDIFDFRDFVFNTNTIVENTSGANIICKFEPAQVLPTKLETFGTITFDNSLTIQIIAPNIVSGSRVQLYNVTQATEIENTVLVSSGYTKSVIAGIDYNINDTLRIRAVKINYNELETDFVATTVDFPVNNTMTIDDVYTTNNLDGSLLDKVLYPITGEYLADYPNVQVDIDDPDNRTTFSKLYAWHKYNETTANGIRYFFGAITAEDTFNYLIHADIIDLQLNNVKPTTLIMEGGYLRRNDGQTWIATPLAGQGSIQPDYGKAYTATDLTTTLLETRDYAQDASINTQNI